jgi:hypothetical protein
MVAKKTPKMTAPKKRLLSHIDRAKLVVETSCAERTIKRWEDGDPVTAATAIRLKKAARKLGIPIPEARA